MAAGRSGAFETGDVLGGKYRVLAFLGAGWEGEVYLLRELRTGVECAAKFFFPQRNPGNRTLRRYARKLHRLRDCHTLIRYRTEDAMAVGGRQVHFLVSEYVEGELLHDFLRRQPGRRLDAFQALHLLQTLVIGVEEIHRAGEYHGDIHESNIIIRRRGLGFAVKLIDLHHWDGSRSVNMQDDVLGLVRILYELVGGRRHYAKQPQEIKAICRGLKHGLILQRFRNVAHLRRHLESLDWNSR